MVFYYTTEDKGVFNAMKNGLAPGEEGHITLYSNIANAKKFLDYYEYSAKAGKYYYAFIPIELDPEEVEEVYDLEERVLCCKRYWYPHEIPAQQIPKSLDDIPLCCFTVDKKTSTSG